MNKYFTPLLAVFLLILLGGESFADRTLEELLEAVAQQEAAQTQEEEELAAQRVQQAQVEVKDAYSDASEEELREIFLNVPDLSPSERVNIQNSIAGRNECADNWWSIVCEITRDDPIESMNRDRFENRIEPIQNSDTNYETVNSQINQIMNEEIQSIEGFENFQGCTVPNSDCRGNIASYCDSQNCGENENYALQIHQAAADNYLIPKSGMIRAAEFLDVSPGAFAAADGIQDLLGFEFSLIKEGSGIDQIFSYGTPEQVCYAKVDSFIDVSGVEVQGQEIEVEDETTGMTSRVKACDNKNFSICADLRAERSGIYFNNSFTLITHFYVYNAKDYDQEVVLNAEFFDEAGNKDSFNVFKKSNRDVGGSITVKSGESESLSLEISNLQVFNGESREKLFGNVLLSVFEKTSNGDENFNEANLDYAIDYPIMEIGGGNSASRENKDEQVENSGAEIVDGTTTGTSSLINRVSLS